MPDLTGAVSGRIDETWIDGDGEEGTGTSSTNAAVEWLKNWPG
jgi:hypothetical protein